MSNSKEDDLLVGVLSRIRTGIFSECLFDVEFANRIERIFNYALQDIRDKGFEGWKILSDSQALSIIEDILVSSHVLSLLQGLEDYEK